MIGPHANASQTTRPTGHEHVLFQQMAVSTIVSKLMKHLR